MTPSEFYSIAPLFISEEETRRALCSAFRHRHHLFASDGRIALICDAHCVEADCINETADESQRGIADSLLKDYVVKIQKRIGGWYEPFPLGKLAEAACAAFADVEPEMMWLRSNAVDDDDPEANGDLDSVRYVHEAFTSVILANKPRSLIAGYYASLIAGLAKFYGPVDAYTDPIDPHAPLFFRGDNWRCILMPRLVKPRNGNWEWDYYGGCSIADAATGELVRPRHEREPDLDILRQIKKGE